MAVGKFIPKSMELKPMDTSSGVYGRKDLAGNNCALVKMVLLMPGISFEGNIVGDSPYKAGEYWVYLSPGTKKFKIKHDNYQPQMIEFSDFGISAVESNCTYELILDVYNDDPAESAKLKEYAEEVDQLKRTLNQVSETDEHKYQRAMETRDISLMKLLAEGGFEKAYYQLAELYSDNGQLYDAEVWAKKAIHVEKDSMMAKFLLRHIKEERDKEEQEKKTFTNRKKAIIEDLFNL